MVVALVVGAFGASTRSLHNLAPFLSEDQLASAVVLSKAASSSADASSGGCARNLTGLVINMKDRSDRLKRFESRLPDTLKGRVFRVPGIEGKSLPSSVPAELVSSSVLEAVKIGSRQKRWPTMATPGTLGLYLAHQLAWSRIVSNNLSAAIVFEDDAIFFADDFEPLLNAACTQLTTVDYIQLQWDDCGPVGTACGTAGAWLKGTIEKPAQRPNVPTMLVDGTLPCAGAYLMTHAGARRALEATRPIRADLQLDADASPFRTELRTRMMTPPIVQCHDGSDSDAQVAGDIADWAKVNGGSKGSGGGDSNSLIGTLADAQICASNTTILTQCLNDAAGKPDAETNGHGAISPPKTPAEKISSWKAKGWLP